MLNEVKNDSFVFYSSIFKSIEMISDIKKRAEAYKCIALYGLCEIEPPEESDNIVKIIFCQAKPVLDSSRKRYNACVENGKKGGRPTKINQTETKQKPKENQKETKGITKDITRAKPNNNLNYNENYNVNENFNYNESEKEFLLSLKNKYSNFTINDNVNLSQCDLTKLLKAVEESKFLQGTTLTFLMSNYDKIINGYYKDFVKPKKESEKNDSFMRHNYTSEELNNSFDNIDDIEL